MGDKTTTRMSRKTDAEVVAAPLQLKTLHQSAVGAHIRGGNLPTAAVASAVLQADDFAGCWTSAHCGFYHIAVAARAALVGTFVAYLLCECVAVAVAVAV